MSLFPLVEILNFKFKLSMRQAFRHSHNNKLQQNTVLVKIVSLFFSSLLNAKVFLQLMSGHKALVPVHIHDVFKTVSFLSQSH